MMSSNSVFTNNEDPSPAAVATYAAHLPYSSSEQPAEGTSQASG